METRSNEKEKEPDDPILGDLVQNLEPVAGSQLPTNQDVLSYYIHLSRGFSKSGNTTKDDVINEVLKKVAEFYTFAGIKHQAFEKKKDSGPKKRLKRLIETHSYLKKNIKNDDYFVIKNANFKKNELPLLFEMMHPNAIELISKDYLRSKKDKDEDIRFINDQKTERKLCLGRVDKRYEKKVKTYVSRKINEAESYQRRQNESSASTSQSHELEAEPESETEIDINVPSTSRDQDFKIRKPKTSNLKLFDNSKTSNMADRLNLSVRQRVGFAAVIASECGHDLEKVTLSKSTVHRSAKRTRTITSEAIKDNYIIPEFASLHWDGKQVKNNNLQQKEERLAIIICGEGSEEGKVLSIPAISDASGYKQAEAAYNDAVKWDAEDSIVTLGFDTTSANTGWANGACQHLELMLGRKLLWCGCRHHALECVLRAIYGAIFGGTSGPENLKFKEFRENWAKIDTNSTFKSLKTTDRKLKTIFEEVKEELKMMLVNNSFIRNDYKECGLIILQILGEIPPKGIKWYRPGAIHHARWMATILYTGKMYAFSDQISCSENEVKNLEKFVIFAIIYIVPWLKATIASDAAYYDLKLYRNLYTYGEVVDKGISERGIHIYQGQFWYLTEELIPMALFSAKVKDNEKKTIAMAIVKNRPKLLTFEKGKPAFPLAKENTKLVNLVGPKSWFFFSALKSSGEWLKTPVKSWDQDDDYKKISKFVSNLKVVNDPSERGVKLIEDFVNRVKDEKERQALIQVVEQERKRLQNFDKCSLKKYSKF